MSRKFDSQHDGYAGATYRPYYHRRRSLVCKAPLNAAPHALYSPLFPHLRGDAAEREASRAPLILFDISDEDMLRAAEDLAGVAHAMGAAITQNARR